MKNGAITLFLEVIKLDLIQLILFNLKTFASIEPRPIINIFIYLRLCERISKIEKNYNF